MVPSLPVVVDTPTSRMDRRHKGWSVTVLPRASNQVIVFAMSDDPRTVFRRERIGVPGAAVSNFEVSENSVEISTQNLRSFE